jgi:hypothetical protein
MKQKLTTFGLAAVAVIASAGWLHEARSTTASAASTPIAVQAPAQAAAPEYFATPAVMRTADMNTPAPQIVQVADRYDRYRNRQLRQRDYGYNNPNYSSRDTYYGNNGYYGDDGYYGPTRPAQKSAVIIGGATAAGAAIGAMTHGGKGAAIGAITGAVGGLIYDRATHNKTSGYGWHP